MVYGFPPPPRYFFLGRLLAYSGPTLSPTTSNSSGTRRSQDRTVLITWNTEILRQKIHVVNTGVSPRDKEDWKTLYRYMNMKIALLDLSLQLSQSGTRVRSASVVQRPDLSRCRRSCLWIDEMRSGLSGCVC